MKAVKEFSRFAASYGQYNTIQRQVAKRLINNFLPSEVGSILDLGCGEGEVFRQLKEKNISFNKFFGVDMSNEMLKLHPKDKQIELIQANFDDINLLKNLKDKGVDTIISASALQWSNNLEQTLKKLSYIGKNVSFAIFTSGTFKSIHKYSNSSSPIRSYIEVGEILQRYYKSNHIEKVEYQLYFNTKKEIFHYIKKSGVSGGEARLTYTKIRNLIENYPLNYLEFELLLFSGKPKISFSKL